MNKTVPCKFQITKDGHPQDGYLMITGIAKTVTIDLFTNLIVDNHHHVITFRVDPPRADMLVDEILGWL